MRTIARGVAVLAVSVSAAWAQESKPGGGSELTAHVKILRAQGENEQPVESSSFALGDTVVCAFWVKGYRDAGGKGMKLNGAWGVTSPDGTPLRMEDTGISAVGSTEVGPDGVLMRPVKGWGLNGNAPAGCYRVSVCVTDAVSRATARAEAPLYVFLTPGARDQVTAPTEKAPLALDTTLLAPGFWETTRDEMIASLWRHGFAWTSDAHTEIRSTLKGLTFLEAPVVEVSLRFSDDQPAEVRLCFYNRGDGGLISDTVFTEQTDRLTAAVKALTGRPPQDLSSTAKTSAEMKQTLLVWRRDATVVRLDYAWSSLKKQGERRRSFQPEYINMVLIPAEDARTRAAMAGTQKASVTRFSLPRNVRKMPNGDVYIEGIPMVDQGEKGYCAAASAERILSYYGTDTDQHELAQRMMMATGGGATFDSMVNGISSISRALKVQLKMIMKPDARAFERLIEDYNREAKKQGAKLIEPGSQAANANIWSLFYKNIFLDSRLKERLAIDKFMKAVRDKVDKGIPLCQCCVIGILPEEAKLEQDPGGHLRLIIGYNLKTSEILYTDSWGAGHERKRMPLGEAFAITIGLFTLEPM